MKKIDILELNTVVASLKLPRMATERRLAWLQIDKRLVAAAADVWAEKEEIAAITDIDDAERAKMWRLVLAQDVALVTDRVEEAEMLAIFDVNEHLTIGSQQMMITKLTAQE